MLLNVESDLVVWVWWLLELYHSIINMSRKELVIIGFKIELYLQGGGIVVDKFGTSVYIGKYNG